LFRTLSHVVMVTLVFLILLCVKVDQNKDWNWFLVFTPLWITDILLLIPFIYQLIQAIQGYRAVKGPREERTDAQFQRDKVTKVKRDMLELGLYMGLVLCKLATELLICLKYQGLSISNYIVCAPLWIMLLGFSIASIQLTVESVQSVKNKTSSFSMSTT